MLCSVAPCNNYKRSGGRRTPFVITICAASVSGGMDSSVKKIIYILLLSCVLITGCEKNKKIDIDKVQSSVNEYYDEFRAGYLRGEIAVTNKPLIGRDGEITRYTDKNGNILRYTLVICGETGKILYEYYFMKEYIYINILDENYTSPIYEKTPYILYRTLKEGVVYKNTIYRLENGEAIESDARTMGLFYKTEEELSDLMNES